MKLFIDTANIDEILEINDWGVLHGVTTNPTLLYKENMNTYEFIKQISEKFESVINLEVISTTYEEIIVEAESLSKINKNIVVKIPLTEDGLKAISYLSKKGIKTNATLVFSTTQAVLAALAGANYVSLFIGRLDDIGSDSGKIIFETAEIYKNNALYTEIIAASIRSVGDVVESAKLGADVITIPYKIFKAMLKHPLTEIGLANFLNDWNKLREGK